MSADEDSDEGRTEIRKRGRPAIENPKQAVSLRLEPDVLRKFKDTGPGWQKRINDVLKNAVLD